MTAFLGAQFETNSSYSKQKLSFFTFTGLLNVFLPVSLLFIFMPTALLICMENTFWNISTNLTFVDLFKKSFTLYVESGTRKKVEVAIDDSILRNEQGGGLPQLTKDSEENFYYRTRKKVATAIASILRKVPVLGGGPSRPTLPRLTKDLEEKFFKIIMEHYLRKFHCFIQVVSNFT